MPAPDRPADLKHCPDCGKVLGDYRGWFGAECQCHLDLSRPQRSHSIKGPKE